MNTMINNSAVDLTVNDVNTKNNIANKQVEETLVKGIQEQEDAKSVKVQETQNEEPANITVKQLEMVAQQLQEFVGGMNKGLEFLVDKDSGRDVIKVIDKTSGDILKQYPSEEVLSLVSKLSEATGSFVNEEV
ncbi:flagellar protein FlaG [Pseudocolwellia sp. HL-MZ19]|uniref:flagellar protein FlaG n=1 Tax=Pseudocolwellia sp. HL-MZ19 TaxID=3400846 RepID=UPI003CE88DA0